MKWSIYIIMLIGVLGSCSSLCPLQSEKYDYFYSYMEASYEEEGHIIIRALYFPSTMTVIDQYKMYYDNINKKYYLTFYKSCRENFGISKDPNIKYMSWGGIQVNNASANFR